jgi:LysR family cys regulon transcriptional activator
MDADVIRTYVSLGLGVGIVASMAVAGPAGGEVSIVPAEGLFEENTTWIAVRRDRFLRGFAYRFMALCDATLTPEMIRTGMVT